MIRRRFPVLILFGSLLAAANAGAQDARFIGRAIGSISGGENTNDAQAGGDAGGPEVVCDESVTECFDVTKPDEGPPAARTLGGAFADAPTPCSASPSERPPRPGFPRVESCAEAALIPFGPIQIFFGGSIAIADSATGELRGERTAALVHTPGGDIPVEPDQTIDLGIMKITGGRETRESKDGLSVITVDGLLVEIPSGGEEMVFGRTIAGLEIPFTTGGGGCSVAGGGSGGVATAGAVLALVWTAGRIVGRRKRRRP